MSERIDLQLDGATFEKPTPGLCSYARLAKEGSGGVAVFWGDSPSTGPETEALAELRARAFVELPGLIDVAERVVQWAESGPSGESVTGNIAPDARAILARIRAEAKAEAEPEPEPNADLRAAVRAYLDSIKGAGHMVCRPTADAIVAMRRAMGEDVAETQTQPALRLEVGKRYVTRRGETVTVMGQSKDSGNYISDAYFGEKWYHLPDGTSCGFCGEPHDSDIIRAADPEPLKLRVGGVYELSDGSLAVCIRRYTGGQFYMAGRQFDESGHERGSVESGLHIVREVTEGGAA